MNSSHSALTDQQRDVREFSPTGMPPYFRFSEDQPASARSEIAALLEESYAEKTIYIPSIFYSALTAQSVNVDPSESKLLHLSNYMRYVSHRLLPAGTELEMPNQRSVWLSPNETMVVGLELNQEGILFHMLNKLFRDSRDETFEDGMDSTFSDSLNRIVLYWGKPAIQALGRVVRMNTDGEVVEEALRQIGRMKDIKTHYYRLALLKLELASPDPRIRDAALIGIEAMDDPAAVPNLQIALSREKYEPLRQNIKAVIDQLQDA